MIRLFLRVFKFSFSLVISCAAPGLLLIIYSQGKRKPSPLTEHSYFGKRPAFPFIYFPPIAQVVSNLEIQSHEQY